MRWSAPVVLVCLLVGCAGDLDPEWQLDHTRVVAIRATPPHIMPGEQSQIDLLVATKGSGVASPAPDAMIVVSPASLADAVSGTLVTAPSDDRLAAARAELGLGPTDPVPLLLGIHVDELVATKAVYLGDTGANPLLDNVTIDGMPAPEPGQMISVAADVDVHLGVDADETDRIVDWYTSCGTMHDFDLHRSYLHVEPDDPQTGELVLVVRDVVGGAVWARWPVVAN